VLVAFPADLALATLLQLVILSDVVNKYIVWRWCVDRCMKMNNQILWLWKKQLPYHIFFLVVAVIIFLRTGSLWGFVGFVGSLALTAILSFVVSKAYRKRGRDVSKSTTS
jgi:hypothetical protein